jgi:membrane-associated protein
MDMISQFVDVFLHIDQHLNTFFINYGYQTYFIIFLIIFCETGLVVTPFLPGDSLLFALGALCAASSLNIWIILIILPIAAILGDNVNYWIGNKFGEKVFNRKNSYFFNRQNLDKAHAFYDKYGGIAITICRFAPILRTFVPFVAGMVKMPFAKFTFFNIMGGIAWTTIFLLLGYFFGNIPFVQEHFEFVIVGIVVFSLLPVVYEFVKSKVKTEKAV